MERKYTVAEIDQMRSAIRWNYPDGIAYNARDRDADVENRLRTYMQNGTDPEELTPRQSQNIWPARQA